MFYLLFIFYFLIICFWLKKAIFFIKSNIGFKTLIALYVTKVLVGILYGIYFAQPSQIEGADTWFFFIESKPETDWLLANPQNFFADLFTNHYSHTGNFFAGSQSFWNDLKATFFVKILAILNVITQKNYYTNLLFFNAAFMVGGVACYRLFNQKFDIDKRILIAAIFLTPGFLFWCSGIHKDGIVFSATALAIFLFNNILQYKISIKKIAVLLLCFVVVFILRNYYLLAILPAFIGWFLAVKYKAYTKIIFVSIIVASVVFFIFSSLFSISNSISQSTVLKHNQFLMLQGNTKFETPPLNANAQSMLSYFPFAMYAAIFRPLPHQIHSKAALLLVIENYCFILLSIAAIVIAFKRSTPILKEPTILACLTISFFLLLFIGYTVCFDTAIIRYRSVSFPLLIVPCLLVVFGKIKKQHLSV